MSQHDQDLANQSGATFRSDANSAFAALFSNNSGAAAPSVTVAYMWWADTTSGLLKQRNAANNAWISVARLADFALPSVQGQLATAFTTGGSSTAFTLTPTPALTALATGQEFDVTFHTAVGSAPTLAVSGLTAKSLKWRDSTGAKRAVTSVQVPSNWRSRVVYDGTDYIVREVRSGGLMIASKSAAYTTTIDDANGCILHPSADTTARTFTIDSNANVPYPSAADGDATAITFINQASAGVVTIAITADTMRLAGAGTTGSRTLAANGIATAIKLSATEWIISGTGLT